MRSSCVLRGEGIFMLELHSLLVQATSWFHSPSVVALLGSWVGKEDNVVGAKTRFWFFICTQKTRKKRIKRFLSQPTLFFYMARCAGGFFYPFLFEDSCLPLSVRSYGIRTRANIWNCFYFESKAQRHWLSLAMTGGVL